MLASMSLSRLPAPPADPSNAVADDPRAAAWGAKLFGDVRLSRNGKLSCAGCHQPGKFFTDGLPRAKGLGVSKRHAPGLLGVAYSPWLFWDGRADSLWAQALGPLGHADELGLSRAQLKRIIGEHHRAEYAALFGAIAAQPAERVAVNVGKSLAAFQRGLRPAPARFDAGALDERERRGFSLFIGAAQCSRCHFGPLLTNHSFHNTGTASAADHGRSEGLRLALASGVNCRSAYSDDPKRACPKLEFARVGAAQWLGAFKTPSLRNVGATAPYLHDGRFNTLAQVLDHYNRAPAADLRWGHSELFPLGLDKSQLGDLERFLLTLGP